MMAWADVPIYLHRGPVDFRKSINGLVGVVQEGLGLSPFARALFVFGNRRRDKIKVLYWDKTGFCLWYKRLEQDKYCWPLRATDAVVCLSREQFDWLLRGLDMARLQPHREQSFGCVG